MKHIFAAGLALCVAWHGTAASAQDYEQAILAQLRQDGYEQITVTTTLLGRIRIVADGAMGQREIVLNPRTGEVLRDVLLIANLQEGAAKRSGIASRTTGASGGSGPSGGSASGGAGSSSDDDDDDDGDDDDDRDNEDEDDDRDDEDDDAEDDDDDDDSGKGRGRGRGGDDD